MNSTPIRPILNRYWRGATLILLLALTLIGILSAGPIAQHERFEQFADGRTFLAIPNFLNVASNLPFLIVGVAGLFLRGVSRDSAWYWFFAGIGLICLGSSYYHLFPNHGSLVADRLPMTMAFMALFVALLSEHADERLERRILWPAMLIGMASVVWWYASNDLRLYLWVQVAPLLTIPLVMSLYRARFTHRIYLLYGLVLYVLAKLAEFYDQSLFDLTGGIMSGHSLKHLLAAGGILCVYLMLARRRALN
ncbi:MAG TPA: ceramidase domain-containing protein [Burkholderiales bacterium]|nr:ceramidase domain-containing protein [Burkholderiales bacterium]